MSNACIPGNRWAVAAFAGNVIGVRLRPYFCFEKKCLLQTDG
ncbi:hypothetical protein [Rhizobium sp. LjRoot258]